MRDWQIAILLGIGGFYLYAFLWTGNNRYEAHWETIFDLDTENVSTGEPP